jgi:hypothetical protein
MIFKDDLQKAFRSTQSIHQCTDCGLDDDEIVNMAAGSNMSLHIVGGGSILQDSHEGPSEIHIIPHGGVELPTDLLRQVPVCHFDELANLVHDNSDIGTRAIHRSLAASVFSGKLKGVAIAAFHVSRLLFDANRLVDTEQVSMVPYTGSPELYADYLATHWRTLRSEFLEPWVNAVNDLLDSAPEGVVAYHHHTMDIYSLSRRIHDIGGDGKRPPFQLFWMRPPRNDKKNRDEQEDRTGLAPREVLEVVRSKMEKYFSQIIGEEEASGGKIDYPLSVPRTPFHGCLNERLDRDYRHIIYEVRKDLLATSESIDRWMEHQPWHSQAR